MSMTLWHVVSILSFTWTYMDVFVYALSTLVQQTFCQWIHPTFSLAIGNRQILLFQVAPVWHRTGTSLVLLRQSKNIAWYGFISDVFGLSIETSRFWRCSWMSNITEMMSYFFLRSLLIPHFEAEWSTMRHTYPWLSGSPHYHRPPYVTTTGNCIRYVNCAPSKIDHTCLKINVCDSCSYIEALSDRMTHFSVWIESIVCTTMDQETLAYETCLYCEQNERTQFFIQDLPSQSCWWHVITHLLTGGHYQWCRLMAL